MYRLEAKELNVCASGLYVPDGVEVYMRMKGSLVRPYPEFEIKHFLEILSFYMREQGMRKSERFDACCVRRVKDVI